MAGPHPHGVKQPDHPTKMRGWVSFFDPYPVSCHSGPGRSQMHSSMNAQANPLAISLI